MKIDKTATIIGLPKDAPFAVDDAYLAEMTDRLHKLRSLVGTRKHRSKAVNLIKLMRKDRPTH